MGNKICARCGADIDVVLGGSGSYLCAYCRGAKQSDSLSRYPRGVDEAGAGESQEA